MRNANIALRLVLLYTLSRLEIYTISPPPVNQLLLLGNHFSLFFFTVTHPSVYSLCPHLVLAHLCYSSDAPKANTVLQKKWWCCFYSGFHKGPEKKFHTPPSKPPLTSVFFLSQCACGEPATSPSSSHTSFSSPWPFKFKSFSSVPTLP